MCPPQPLSQLGLGSETGEGEVSFPSLGLSSRCSGLTSVPGAASEAATAEHSGKWIFLCGPPALSPEESLQKGVDFIKRGWEPSLLSEDKPELDSQKPQASLQAWPNPLPEPPPPSLQAEGKFQMQGVFRITWSGY